jgi:hypothetical protein
VRLRRGALIRFHRYGGDHFNAAAGMAKLASCRWMWLKLERKDSEPLTIKHEASSEPEDPERNPASSE